MGDTWIDKLIPLPRPEYAKQTESLLTDLLWRSPGSSLSSSPNKKSYLSELAGLRTDQKNPPYLERLIPHRARGDKHPAVEETIPYATKVDISGLVGRSADIPSPIRALLDSIIAPRSSGDRALACVPVHLEAVVLQTLHGLVNKKEPPNMASAIEALGWLGGSGGMGQVASTLIQSLSSRVMPREGLAGLLDLLFPAISAQTWRQLSDSWGDATRKLPEWPGVLPISTSAMNKAVLAAHPLTPFRWFWDKWLTLCDPDNGWYAALPARRYIDWALCLLRTGLAFAYLWEAEFFTRLYACIVEFCDTPSGGKINIDLLRSMTKEGVVLATIESTLVLATQKHAWPALASLLARGYLARDRVKDNLQKVQFTVPEGKDIVEVVEEWLNSLDTGDLQELAEPLVVKDTTANNQREFVRYLLRPRASDDDTADQADFYHLARTDKSNRKFWFQPGPEWLVVMTSLLAKRPGGSCTLGMLLSDMVALGIKVDRWVLVGMLEEAGLSTDSPDADNAIIIKASF